LSYPIIHRITRFFQTQPRYIAWLIKGGLVVFFLILLWYEVFQRENIEEYKAAFIRQLRGGQTAWLVSVVLLLPFNWATETLKWLHLVRKAEPMTFGRAYQAVLAGVTFSMFTPNRVGEFGGRILFLKWRNALKGTFSTIVGSFAQQIILISFGFLGFAYFLIVLWQTPLLIVQVVIFLGVALILLMIFIFLNLELVVPLFKKIKWLYRFPRLIKNVNIVRRYSQKELLLTLWWAFARYIIYGTQYYLMLRFFGIDPPLLRGGACIATIYLLQTSIPLPPIIGLLARGNIALQVWGLFTENKISILAATFSIWFINLIIPAFVGLILILNKRISN
jgi:uncharacterized membrane protein YbhN (UPF0104 family)